MSAQQAHLEEWLQEAVSLGAVSEQEAWMLQDAALLTPPGFKRELPEVFEPMIDRLFLLEARPANRLPV